MEVHLGQYLTSTSPVSHQYFASISPVAHAEDPAGMEGGQAIGGDGLKQQAAAAAIVDEDAG